MATRKEAAEKKKELSCQISTLIRTLSLSVLAVAWLFLAGNKDVPAIVQLMPKNHTVTIAALCVLAIAFDLIQYLAGYLQVSKDYAVAKAAQSEDVVYSESVVRSFAFRAKIFLCLVASAWLVAMLFWALVTIPKKPGKKDGSAETVIIIER